MSKLDKKLLPAQTMYEIFKPLTPAESISFQNAIRDPFYRLATTFTDQIGVLCYYMRNGDSFVSYDRIGKLFHKTRYCVLHHHRKFLRGERKDGRPLSLTKDELTIVKNNILIAHALKPPIFPTYDDILEFIKSRFDKDIQTDTLRKLLLQQLGDIFRPCLAKPIDKDRMEASIEKIEANYLQLRNLIHEVPIPFCFNIDEMGHTDYADAPIKTVIVPFNYNKMEAQHPVERSCKRASVIACISPIGLVCPPQFAIESRNTIDKKLFKYVSSNSVQLVGTDSGFVNTESFLLWLKEKFLPELRILRQKFKYNGRAVIITDGLLAHKSAFDSIDLSKENLVIHYLEPHSSDQVQPLDLGIFGGMKRFLSNYKNNTELSPAANQILKIFQALYQMCTPINCRAAFRASGLIT